MAFAGLIPWGRNRPMTTATARFGEGNDPFAALSRDMNRLLDDFTRGFGVSVPTGFGASGTWPHVEVIETEKEVKVVAELPGMEQNDIDLSLHSLRARRSRRATALTTVNGGMENSSVRCRSDPTWIRKGWERHSGTEC